MTWVNLQVGSLPVVPVGANWHPDVSLWDPVQKETPAILHQVSDLQNCDIIQQSWVIMSVVTYHMKVETKYTGTELFFCL